MNHYAQLALEEYNSDTATVRRAGFNGKPFWNSNSSQFMYVPQFYFPSIPGAVRYIYTAADSKGNTVSFEADTPIAPLTPIWKDLAVGFVELKVEAVNIHGGKKYLAGARTFYKTAPFPGREALPEKACSYRECARRAFRFVFNTSANQHWLKYGTPDPNYYHNVFPSKMIGSIVRAMIAYAELEPEHAEDAMKLAVNAADYLLSISYPGDSPFAGLPPTYSFEGITKELIDQFAPAANDRRGTIMMIYPAMMGSAYLQLEKATGDAKYFEAAKCIAEYYRANVLPNGSWHLLLNENTGEPVSPNCCVNFSILGFLNSYGKRTGEACWHELERNYYNYLIKICLENYNWEGQFEDTVLASQYSNLTHLNADQLITYITKNLADDPEMMREAEELMRFVEDQFVVWGEHAPWNRQLSSDRYFYSPAALEQYEWYVPIDGSTGAVAKAFLSLYKATGKPLYREKACALADSMTRMQNPETGVIPTHWMTKDCSTKLYNFWINCHVGSAFTMLTFAKDLGEV